MIRDLKTIYQFVSPSSTKGTGRAITVQVWSFKRLFNARKTSAIPASPACVAIKICSTYLDFGAASWRRYSQHTFGPAEAAQMQAFGRGGRGEGADCSMGRWKPLITGPGFWWVLTLTFVAPY